MNEGRPKLMIATPMYGGMCTGAYVQGLLKTIPEMSRLQVPVQWAQITNESLIPRARNELVRLFLAGNATHLLFIDADIGFDEKAVLRLLAVDEDIVCGIYPKKEIDWDAIEAAAERGEKNLRDFAGAFVLGMASDQVVDDRGVIEVRHAGTGFMMIKRGVFEHLQPHVPIYRMSTITDKKGHFLKPVTYEFFDTSIDAGGALLSEDYHFCDLFRRHGGKIYAYPEIRLQHVGTYTHEGHLLRAGGNIK